MSISLINTDIIVQYTPKDKCEKLLLFQQLTYFLERGPILVMRPMRPSVVPSPTVVLLVYDVLLPDRRPTLRENDLAFVCGQVEFHTGKYTLPAYPAEFSRPDELVVYLRAC